METKSTVSESNEELHLMYDYRPKVIIRDLQDLQVGFSLEDDEKYTSQHYGGNDAYARALRALPLFGHILDAGSGLGGFGRYAAVKSNGSLVIDSEELNEDFHNLAQRITKTMTGVSETNCIFRCADLLKHQDEKKYDGVVSFLTFLHIQDKDTLFQNLYNRMKPDAILYIEDLIAGRDISMASQQCINNMKYTVAFSFPLLTIGTYAQILEQHGFYILSIVDKSIEWSTFTANRAEVYENNLPNYIDRYGDKAASSYLHFYKCIQNLFKTKAIGGVEIIAVRK